MTNTKRNLDKKKAAEKVARDVVVRKSGRTKKATKKVFDGPLVSIVMPAFNAAAVIDDTIHSVLGQTYENFELIIVDDASTDGTLDVVGQFGDERIKVIKCKKNGGAAKARNRGVKAAKGEFLAFIDADDMWQPRKLERQLDFMREKEAAFSFGSYVFADAKGRPNGKVVRVPECAKFTQGFKKNLIATSTVMLDMKVISKADAKMEQGERKWARAFEKAGRAYGMNGVVAIRGYAPNMSFFEKMRRGVR